MFFDVKRLDAATEKKAEMKSQIQKESKRIKTLGNVWKQSLCSVHGETPPKRLKRRNVETLETSKRNVFDKLTSWEDRTCRSRDSEDPCSDCRRPTNTSREGPRSGLRLSRWERRSCFPQTKCFYTTRKNILYPCKNKRVQICRKSNARCLLRNL